MAASRIKRATRYPRVLWIVASLLAAVFLTVLALNFVPGERRVATRITHAYAVHDEQFMRTMGVLLGPGIVNGNKVDTLVNGRQIFPAMLEAIRSARETITFETYIYWSGQIGQQFATALSDRARAGVKVHVLLDWVGSNKMEQKYLDAMREAGVEIEKFHPLQWYHLARLNNRTHRKLLVIDGRIGFTGGVGIADAWDGDAQDPEHWRDTHYRIEGPAVAQVQATFVDNWTKVKGDVLHGRGYFPPLAAKGKQAAQMFSSSPSGGSESMQLMYLLAIAAATKTIDLSMAYFVPDQLAVLAFIDARKRGVRVRMIVPGKFTDSPLTRRASRAQWGPLLAAGRDLRIPAYALPLQDHGRRRADGIRGLDQLRRSLVSPERRSELERIRSRSGSRAGACIRAGSYAVTPYHPRRMGRAPARGKILGARGRAVQLTVISRR